ncbi:MAG: MFS transporter [Deltaproteobacteria bacterium]|nr:MFS transporter [Deltaproteobacteria bacterium]
MSRTAGGAPAALATAGSGAGLPVAGPWLQVVLFLTSIFLLNFLSRLAMAPLLPVIEKDLALGHAQAGSFFLFVSLGYCTSLLCSGFVASRLGHRRTIIISGLAVGGAMLFMGSADSLLSLQLGLLALGLGGGLYLPSGIASLTELVEPRLWGRALAIHEVAPNLGFFAAPFLAEILLLWMPWRGALTTLGAVALVLAAAFWRWGQGGRERGRAPRLAALAGLVKNRAVLALTVLLVLGLGGSLAVFTMLPLYLTEFHGLPRGLANFLVGLSRLSGVGMAFVAGWASDRFGPRAALTATLVLGGLFTFLLGLADGWWLRVVMFLQPAAVVCLFPPLFASLAESVSPAERNLAVSLAAGLGIVVGAGLVPIGLGWLGDRGQFPLGFSIFGVLLWSGLAFLPWLGKKAPVGAHH